MNELIILHSTPLRELTAAIGEIIKEELKHFRPEKEPQTPNRGDYLSRKEVCDQLKISPATLHIWTKNGTLQGYRVGGRVLYKTAEVENTLSEIPNLKTRRG